MARGWEAKIGADTREFEQGVKKGIVKPVEEAAKSLDDLTDAGEGVGRDGSRGVGKLEDALKDAERQSERTERAVDDIGDTGPRSFRRLGDAGSEVSSELRQNLGETFSSFRGELEDLPQIAQDTLGGLAGSGALGGIAGIAATAAGAAGLGLITKAFQDAEEKRKRLEERAADLAQAYIDAGSTVLDAFSTIDKAEDVLGDDEARAEVEAYAKALGVDFSVALGAYVGRAEDLAAVQALVAEKTREAAAAEEQHNTSQSQGLLALDDRYRATQDAINAGQELIEVTQTAERQFATYSEYLAHVADSTAGAKRETDEFGDTIVTLPDGKRIYIDAETGQATKDVEAIEDKVYSLNGKTGTMQVDVDTRPARAGMNALVRDITNTTAKIKIGGSGSARQILGG